MRTKLFSLTLLFAFLCTPALFARRHRSRWIHCTATAYSVSGETRDGDLTKYRQTITADPAIMPLGSKVKIEGAGRYSGVYTVTDTGRKIQGRSVDIYIPSAVAAKAFGKKLVLVRILKVGDEKPAAKEAVTQAAKQEARLQPGIASRP